MDNQSILDFARDVAAFASRIAYVRQGMDIDPLTLKGQAELICNQARGLAEFLESYEGN